MGASIPPQRGRQALARTVAIGCDFATAVLTSKLWSIWSQFCCQCSVSNPQAFWETTSDELRKWSDCNILRNAMFGYEWQMHLNYCWLRYLLVPRCYDERVTNMRFADVLFLFFRFFALSRFQRKSDSRVWVSVACPCFHGEFQRLYCMDVSVVNALEYHARR